MHALLASTSPLFVQKYVERFRSILSALPSLPVYYLPGSLGDGRNMSRFARSYPWPQKCLVKCTVHGTNKTNSLKSYPHDLSDVDLLTSATVTALCARIDWRRLMYWNRISVHHEMTIHEIWTPKLSPTVTADTIRGLLNYRVS